MTLVPYRAGPSLPSTLTETLPHVFRRRLERELEPDEALLWTEVPTAQRLWMTSFAVIPFALFWNCFVAFWMWSAAHASILFSLFGLPFAIVGLYLLGLPYRSWKNARATFYALTDRRAILFSADTVRSLTPNMMNELIRTERPDGTGDLALAQEQVPSGRTTRTLPVGFLGIRNPKEVERLIRDHLRL